MPSRHCKSMMLAFDKAVCCLQSYVNLLDGVLALPANAVPVPLPAAGSGPNNGVGIEAFNMTTSASPTMAISTAG